MKQVVIIILMLLSALNVKGQTNRIDSLLLDLFNDDKTFNRLVSPAKLFLYSGFNYDDRAFYAGRELGDHMHVVTGNVYLFHTNGFYAGASGLWYNQLHPSYTATVAVAGFRKPLNKKHTLTGRISYNRYFFNLPDSVISGVNLNSVGAGLTWRNSKAGARVSFNAMFGNDFGMNLTSALFANLNLVHFGETGRLCLAPEVSAFFGSETIGDESTGTAGDPLSATLSTTDKYGLLNTQAYIPLCLYAGDFSFEFGYSVNIPFTQDSNADYPISSFFSFSIGLLLPLD